MDVKKKYSLFPFPLLSVPLFVIAFIHIILLGISFYKYLADGKKIKSKVTGLERHL